MFAHFWFYSAVTDFLVTMQNTWVCFPSDSCFLTKAERCAIFHGKCYEFIIDCGIFIWFCFIVLYFIIWANSVMKLQDLGSSDFDIFYKFNMLHVFLVWPWKPKILSFLKYWTVSILFDLLSSEKSSTAPFKRGKKIRKNWVYRVSKKAEFWADFKNVQKSRLWQTGEKNFTEKLTF